MRRVTVETIEPHTIWMWFAASSAPKPDSRVLCETEAGEQREGRVTSWVFDGKRPQEIKVAIALDPKDEAK